MPSSIRTIGPVHLEDLEPHRFEDLIRQLAYDFRPWLSIEPTGRTGADAGYDARAWERIEAVDEQTDEDGEAPTATRLWLIQCKREKRISPKKLETYMAELPRNDDEPIYGLIFAAACDFTIAARDLFRTKARELGFGEAYLWGKGEVEDQLFQPKNDHLLFAYCGFSLQVRKRTLKTEVRARLSTKRKATKLLATHKPLLIRDASDERYPYLGVDKNLPRIKRGRWKVFERGQCKWDGIHLAVRRQFAFFDKDDLHWDRAETMNDAAPHSHHDPWADNESDLELSSARQEAMLIWNNLDEQEKAWYEMFVVLPYENVLDFDEEDDDAFDNGIQIFTGPWVNDTPFRPYFPHELRTTISYAARYCNLDEENRVTKFPRASADGC